VRRALAFYALKRLGLDHMSQWQCAADRAAQSQGSRRMSPAGRKPDRDGKKPAPEELAHRFRTSAQTQSAGRGEFLVSAGSKG
jgi:hypothetical protein